MLKQSESLLVASLDKALVSPRTLGRGYLPNLNALLVRGYPSRTFSHPAPRSPPRHTDLWLTCISLKASGKLRTYHFASVAHTTQVMCYKETPYHGCGHYGKPRFVRGEPCIRATSQSSLSNGCWNVVDMGIANVKTLCSKCFSSTSSASSIRSLSSSSFSGSEGSYDSDSESRGRTSSISTDPSSAASSRASSCASAIRPMPCSLPTALLNARASDAGKLAPPDTMYGVLPKKTKAGTLKSCSEH